MKKKLLNVLFLLGFAVFLMNGCDDSWLDEIDDVEAEESAEVTENAVTGQNEPNENTGFEPVEIGSDARSATVMIYMNGSDLETEGGLASRDIAEMIGSGAGENVNVIVQTMGTKEWHDFDISSDTTQIYRVHKGELELISDNIGQLDCTKPGTLSDFIGFGKKNYPADRYMLILWDHGGGPVYGFGYDEWQPATSALTLDEIQQALGENSDISFDIIGMDCCIMASLETCYVLSPFCKYALLSEDFESALGWSYKEWLKLLEENPGISTPLLGKKIIDGIITSNDNDPDEGGSSTIILANEKAVPDLFKKWTEYAYKNTDDLLGSNYSKLHKAIGRSFFENFFDSWSDDESYVTMEDFYVSDIMSIVESVGAEGEITDDLRMALKGCVAYFGHTSDKNELTGLSISLPYGDRDYYDSLVSVYSKCGFDKTYIDWLEGFVSAKGSENYNDYSEFEDLWNGWVTYEQGWSSCEGCDDSEDWEYDYEEKIWYLYEDGSIYLYDDETDSMFVYDELEDEMYYYDENDDEWYLVEDDE